MTALNAKVQLTQRLGYTFTDFSLAEQALTHRSFGGNHNERLEFLGDSIVNFVVAEQLYRRFPAAPEGELTRMRARLIKGETLAAIAAEYRFGDALNLGATALKTGGFRNQSILADALEAMIGAIYLDGGIEPCRARIPAWYGERLAEVIPGDSNKDAKTRLQELLQAKGQALPVYRVLNTVGQEHNQQLFTVGCDVPSLRRQFSGSGSNRRSAEQAAAQAALDYLEINQE